MINTGDAVNARTVAVLAVQRRPVEADGGADVVPDGVTGIACISAHTS